MVYVLYYAIIGLSVFNILRLAVFLISSDIYEFKNVKRQKKFESCPANYEPWVSVVVPAHNEEVCIERTVQSVLVSDYKRKQVIVVNDGSTDGTARILRKLQKTSAQKFKVVKQKNLGKAAAINNALTNHARGSLVMVLDADSLLDQYAIKKAVAHFQNKDLLALASNVKILNPRGFIQLAQKFEYIVSYRVKRALTTLNTEYIIGGVGSMFRKSALKKVGYYDSDTMTEDIDLTLKLIARFGNRGAIKYGADVITYTEAVLTFRALVKQRYRWKYGRFQGFLKNKQLFFNGDSMYDKKLTYFQLPQTLLSELSLLLDPLIIGGITALLIVNGDTKTILSAYLVATFFYIINIASEETESVLSRAKLIAISPFAYFLFYILLLVDYFALILSVIRTKQLLRPQPKTDFKWQHVERAGAAGKA